MKILLLGEFSSLHNLIQEGLQQLDHEVVVASSGDGYRNVNRDIDMAKKASLGIFTNPEHLLRMIKNVKGFKGYDTVQLMSPIIFPMKFGLNTKILKYLKNNNDKLFLLGAGASTQNSIIADFLQYNFKYPDLYKIAKTDSFDQMWSQTAEGRSYNDWLHEIIDGYIPIMYEYAQGYRNLQHSKLRNTIPIPANLDKIDYIENKISNKVKIFHGISRADKGTSFISEAMNNIKKRYPNDVDVIMKGNLPLSDYLKILDSTNIVVDQTYAVSYGVNAVYNLAKGKIVMGGGEKECLKEFGVLESPMVPIEPCVKHIESQLEKLLEEKSQFKEMGYASRKFAEDVHDYKKIAGRYVETWNLKSN